MELRVQHIGICVESIDEYMKKVGAVLGAKEVGGGRLKIPAAGQTSALVEMAGINYEFMEPIGTEGVVPKFLEKRGEGFHHIGVYCSDTVALAKIFDDLGLKYLGDPASGGFFSSPKSSGGILYEFSQIDDMKRDV